MKKRLAPGSIYCIVSANEISIFIILANLGDLVKSSHPTNPEPLNPDIPKARRLAQRFTPQTSFHHPHLDPNVPKENLRLVPPALFAGRKLNWEHPRPTVANLHIVLRLANDPNNFLREFHDKIPQIQDVLGRWSEVKAASPTSTGEAQLRAREPIGEERNWTSQEGGKGTTFNLVSSLDLPGRADIIYLTNAAEDSREHAKDSSPLNLMTMEWLGFDGSYVHVEDAEPKKVPIPAEQDSDFDEHVMRRSSIPSNLQSTGFDFDEHSMRRNNTPSNLRNTEWLDDGQPTKTSFRVDQDSDFGGHSMRRDSTPSNFRVTEWDDAQYTDLDAYSWEPQSDAENTSSEIGPYETFWMNHKGLNSR